MNWERDTKRGTRVTHGCRPYIRKAYDMSAVSAISKRGAFGVTDKQLIQREKPPKFALTAIMRKLVIQANS